MVDELLHEVDVLGVGVVDDLEQLDDIGVPQILEHGPINDGSFGNCLNGIGLGWSMRTRVYKRWEPVHDDYFVRAATSRLMLHRDS